MLKQFNRNPKPIKNSYNRLNCFKMAAEIKKNCVLCIIRFDIFQATIEFTGLEKRVLYTCFLACASLGAIYQPICLFLVYKILPMLKLYSLI